MTDTLHTIQRSIQGFFTGTLLSRVSGMLRDMSMAYVFGTQPLIALFMVAFRLAHTLRRLLGEGALQAAFIPTFEELRHQSEERAFVFFSQLTYTLSYCLIGITTIIAVLLYALLNFFDFFNDQLLILTLLMLPSIFFICLYGLNASFLQCQKKYFLPSVAPCFFNLIWIISIFFVQDMPIEKSVYWLAFCIVIACFAQWLVTVWPTKKILRQCITLPANQTLFFTDCKKLFQPLCLGILGVAASQINNLIDAFFAYFADPEGPALLWYAARIQQLPLALFGIAIANALLPPLARAIKAERFVDYQAFLQHAFKQTCLFMLPLSCLLFLVGDSAINFLYARGSFGVESLQATTYCLWGYTYGLIPSALILVLAPACYAQQNYRLPALISLTTIFCNSSLNFFFIQFLHWGAVSIAFTTSLSAWINLFWLARLFTKQGVIFFPKENKREIIQASYATFLAALGVYLLRTFTLNQPLFAFNLLPTDFVAQFYSVSLPTLLFGCLFVLIQYPRKVRFAFLKK